MGGEFPVSNVETCSHFDEADVRFPVLLNTWKHHAGTLRERIAACNNNDQLGLLASRLVKIGAELMDLYTGALPPAAIAEKVIALLESDGRLALCEYRPWVAEAGGYRTVTLAEDQSQWVLRLGEETGRYVHIHPGRWAPNTRRVRANVLKTAVMVLAHARVHGGDARDIRLINTVRQKYLSLSPMRSIEGEQGLGAVLSVLETGHGRRERKNQVAT